MRHVIAARSALAGALLSLAGLATAAPAGDRPITVQVGERTRTCLVHLPPAYDGTRALPLVIAIHGSGGTGQGMAGLTGFNGMADRHGFIAAYPDGIVAKQHTWNSLYGRVPGGQGITADDVDDVAFLRTLIDALHDSYHTDPSRVFICGHSAGAYMSYRMAMELPDRIAAAGIVNGSLGIKSRDGVPSVPDIPGPAGPVSVIHICGKKTAQ
jgi:polyhydroxybutyrate depolymerase